MSATVYWRPEPMTARLIAAARPAAFEVAQAARARAMMASARVAGSIEVTGVGQDYFVRALSPLGTLFEHGVRPHEIEPKGKVLKLADGRFVTGSVRHPGMQAKPFLRPSSVLWPTFYQRTAAAALRGF